MKIKTIETFETTDGRLHRSRSSAEYHQTRIDNTARANDLLVKGASLGVALRESNLVPAECYPELDEVFTTTKLVISHWQCRDEPGYSVAHVEDDGGIYVFGHAGSWSGSYGAVCSLMDVSRYWIETKRRAPKESQP